VPTPRNGGVAILLPLLASFLLVALREGSPRPADFVLLLGVFVLAVLGFITVVRSLSVITRLVVQAGISALYLWGRTTIRWRYRSIKRGLIASNSA